MASYQIVLRGKAINIVYQHIRQQPIPLGVSVDAQYFNKPAKKKKVAEGKWIKSSCPDGDAINTIISDRLGELRSYVNRYLLDEKKYPEPESMAGFFKNVAAGPATFEKLWAQFTYYKAHCGDDSVGVDRIKQYGTAIKYLLEFKPHTLIDKIDVAYYHGFKDFLQKEKKCGENRIGSYVNIFKAFLHWAIENEKTSLQERLVRKFKVKWAQRDIIFHPVNELQLLFDVDIEAKCSAENKWKYLSRHVGFLERNRDAYLLQCFTGFRHSDARREVEWAIVNNFLRLTSVKTGIEITLPLRTEVLYLINKYSSQGLPFPSYENQPYNRAIRQVAELAGITDLYTFVHGRKQFKPGQTEPKFKALSSHVARATFICMMIEAGIHTRKIMAMTGIKEEKTINHYAAVLKSSLSNEMAMVEEKQGLRITHLAQTA